MPPVVPPRGNGGRFVSMGRGLTYVEKKTAGICVRSGCWAATADHLLCAMHREERRQYVAGRKWSGRKRTRKARADRARYKARREAGMCNHCPRPLYTATLCKQCAEEQRRYNRDYYARRVGRVTKQLACGNCGAPGHSARSCEANRLTDRKIPVTEYAQLRPGAE